MLKKTFSILVLIIVLCLSIIGSALAIYLSVKSDYIGKSFYTTSTDYKEAALTWMLYFSFVVLNLFVLFLYTKRIMPNYYYSLTDGHGIFLLASLSSSHSRIGAYIGFYTLFGFNYPNNAPLSLKFYLNITRYSTLFFVIWFIYLFLMAIITSITSS